MTDLTERQTLIRRFPVLTTTAEHECFADTEHFCPCFTVLEVLEDEWTRRLDAGDDFGACGLRFDEFVADELRRAGLIPADDVCECGDSECHADHNADTKWEAYWHDRI